MKLSIIIPVYNAGNVLGRTIDSVLNQGLDSSEYEIILVNDGSKDNSLEVCNAYAEKYPFLIRVLSKENEGVSKARNLGMKHALGDYLYFMDADDYLLPNGLHYLTDSYLDNNIDILVFYIGVIEDFDNDHLPEGDISGSIVYEGSGIEYLKHNWQTFVVSQLFKRSFILDNNLFFPDLIYSEDLYFNLQVWSKNPNVRIVSSRIYRYIIYKDNNQATKKRDIRHLRKCINGHMKLFSYISELNTLFKEKYDSSNMEILFQSVMRSFMSRVLSSDLSTSEFREIINRLTELNLIPVNNIQSRNTKIIDFMIRHNNLFPIYQIVYKNFFIPFVLPRLSRE